MFSCTCSEEKVKLPRVKTRVEYEQMTLEVEKEERS